MFRCRIIVSLWLGCLMLSGTPFSHAGMVEAQNAYRAGDYATALDEFRGLADSGDRDAQYYLALMYLNGQGTEEDAREALLWFRKSAAQGRAEAQYNLGVFYVQPPPSPR